MNSQHQELCSSPGWAEFLQTEVLPRLVAGVDLGTDMLELGPGFGAATKWLRHRVGRLTALELDPSSADALRARVSPAVAVVTGDCTDTGFAAGSFDSVAGFTMLHHLPSAAAQQATLAEALRLLRPGGVLLGSDSLASTGLHHFHADDTYNPVEPVRLMVWLQALGFRPITVTVGDQLTFTAVKPDGTGTRN